MESAKPTIATKVKTPLGLVLPAGVYGAGIALIITVASALIMIPLEIPLWAWALAFLVLAAVMIPMVPKIAEDWEADELPGGKAVFVARPTKRPLVFAAVCAVILLGVVAALVFL
ncbi:hypothetical protein [Corynebacterium otitidis]|uniref:hypothetical protein n=1 Tax=Corynebacterium otitidis TaxID=29321 RepID=UPI0006281666|nr:hypothetical protein [Corynebacterium otitidis]KKO84191.1 hypothetical protein AAV33_02485 [Corynebacterium otitidis]